MSSTTLMKSLTALRLTGKGQPPLYCRRDLHRDQHPTERMRPVPQNLPVPLCPAQEEKGALVPRTIQCIVAQQNNVRRSPGACCPRGSTDPPGLHQQGHVTYSTQRLMQTFTSGLGENSDRTLTVDHLRTGYMLEVQRALTRGALPPSLPWDRRDGKGEEKVERADCKCQCHDRFHPRETGNRG